jgi:hypothetical protein
MNDLHRKVFNEMGLCNLVWAIRFLVLYISLAHKKFCAVQFHLNKLAVLYIPLAQNQFGAQQFDLGNETCCIA